MAWIEVHQSLPRHPKLIHLARDLNEKKLITMGRLLNLWLWALDVTEDGALRNTTNQDIAHIMEWHKSPDDLVQAMVKDGWLDDLGDGILAIHDWQDYTAKLSAAKESRRLRASAGGQARMRELSAEDRSALAREAAQRRWNASLMPASVPATNQTNQTNNKLVTKLPARATERVLKGEQKLLFRRFWEMYPKKRSKGQAERAFCKIDPDEQLLATMLATIERAKTSDDWKDQNGRFVPFPATWLNARGWEDDFKEEGNNVRAPGRHTQTAQHTDEDYERSIAKFKHNGGVQPMS